MNKSEEDGFQKWLANNVPHNLENSCGIGYYCKNAWIGCLSWARTSIDHKHQAQINCPNTFPPEDPRVTVYKAWLNGTKIQWKYKDVDHDWGIASAPSWSWEEYDYRIKPEEPVIYQTDHPKFKCLHVFRDQEHCIHCGINKNLFVVIGEDKKKRLIRVEELPFPCLVYSPIWNKDKVPSCLMVVTMFDEGKLLWVTRDNKLSDFSIEELVKMEMKWAAPCARLDQAVWNSFEVEE